MAAKLQMPFWRANVYLAWESMQMGLLSCAGSGCAMRRELSCSFILFLSSPSFLSRHHSLSLLPQVQPLSSLPTYHRRPPLPSSMRQPYPRYSPILPSSRPFSCNSRIPPYDAKSYHWTSRTSGQDDFFRLPLVARVETL
jgi:hypothetical protein